MAATIEHKDFPASRTGLVIGDLWGGIAAATVLMPQAMAFGVALYAIAGLDAAAGAYAGLAGTAIICISSGVLGGARGLISAPTGPTLVLLGGALAGLQAGGLADSKLLFGLAATIVLAGVLQFLVGLSGGGRLIKYIPFPVVSGFMTGSAILMILSQRGALLSSAPAADWAAWFWLPAVTALVTIVAAGLVERKLAYIPGPVAGLVIGTLAFHAIAATNGAPVPMQWMIGEVPGLRFPDFEISSTLIQQLPFSVMLPAAAALAVLASLDTLLTAVVADVATGERHDSRIEMMGQGAGQIVTGLLGGMAGAGTTGATVIAIRSGGRRWVGVATGLVFILLVAVGGDIGRILPIGALAGVILYVAIDLADRDIVMWLRQTRTRQDAGVAVLVTLITVFYDLMIAVAIGVVIAAMLYIREQIRAPVVHRRSTAAQMHSIRKRTDAERAALDANGERIIVYELRGSLFFGTADRLIDELGIDLKSANWIILHMRKVAQVDLTALKLLRQIAERLHEHGGTLLLCELHHGAGIGSDFAEALGGAGQQPLHASVLTFNGRDEALEFAENKLLEALEFERTRISDHIPLARNAIAAYLEDADITVLSDALKPQTLERNSTLFRTGDEGDDVYLVLRGEIEIRIPTTAHHYKRLASYGPGTFFGELALLRRGLRAADAIAVTPVELLSLPRAAFDDIKRSHPNTAIAVLSAICDALVANQRWSTREMQRLAEW